MKGWHQARGESQSLLVGACPDQGELIIRVLDVLIREVEWHTYSDLVAVVMNTRDQIKGNFPDACNERRALQDAIEAINEVRPEMNKGITSHE